MHKKKKNTSSGGVFEDMKMEVHIDEYIEPFGNPQSSCLQ